MRNRNGPVYTSSSTEVVNVRASSNDPVRSYLQQEFETASTVRQGAISPELGGPTPLGHSPSVAVTGNQMASPQVHRFSLEELRRSRDSDLQKKHLERS